MKIYGLTGNIASGKSTVAKEFEKLGAFIIDADKVAREVVEPEKTAWKEIVDHFGEGILNEDKSLNRKKLGEIVFNHSEERKKLNEITHPKIIANIEKQISDSDSEIIIIEAALLEKGGILKDILSGVIVVVANPKIQIKRIIERDGMTEKEAKSRISSQVSNKEKIVNADFIVENNLDIEDVKKQVNSIWGSIT